MNGMIALCADEASLMHPEAIGLEGVDLDATEWLTTFSRGAGVRRALENGVLFHEIWVISTEDLPAINLVGALRKDGFSGTICMIVQRANGSVLSRAKNAGASEVLSLEALAKRYFVEANRRMRMGEVRTTLRSGNPRLDASLKTRTEKAKTSVQRSVPAVAGSAIRAERTHEEGFLLAVVSGSGGVGKSSICACAAAALAECGRRVLVIDADLQFGDVAQMLAEGQTVSIEEAAADQSMLSRLARAHKQKSPAIISAPAALEQSEVLGEQVMSMVREAIKLFDIVIVDTGSSWSELNARLLESASCALFVMDQRSGSVRACKHALDLCRRMGSATTTFTFVLNRCSRSGVFTPIDISCTLDGSHVHELKEGGFDVEDLCASGMAARLLRTGNPFALSVAELMDEVMPYGSERRSTCEWNAEANRIHIYEEEGHVNENACGRSNNLSILAGFGERRKRGRHRKRRRNEPMVVQMGPDRTRETSMQIQGSSDGGQIGYGNRNENARHVQVLS